MLPPPPRTDRVRAWTRRTVFGAGLVVCGWLAALLVAHLVPLPGRLAVQPSDVVLWRDGSAAHVFLAPDDRYRLPVTELPVDPAYESALIAYEDARFWWHPGVDPISVVRAAGQNLRAGRVVSGASTLTMQLVRILEPRPRTLRSKAVEALRALQLELRLSKREILDAYLQFAPYGGNREGVQTASHALYGHSAAHLTADEIALLIAIPQDPSQRVPGRAPAGELRQIRDRVARRLADAGALPLGSPPVPPEQALADVSGAMLPSRVRPMPRSAPHAARWLRAELRTPGPRLDSSLDAGTQRVVEAALDRVQPVAQRAGVHHAAVVVVAHDTGQVRALAGSFDFWAAQEGAQIPGFVVPRSPGSTLKPLLYALAIDDGRVLPEHRVLDVPSRYGSYAPVNYLGTYDGVVRLDDALSRSLNVPFVRLLQEYGVGRFLGRLQLSGVRSMHPDPDHYGLSVITGGIELSPLDLARIYGSLASGGHARSLTFAADGTGDVGGRVVGPGAAWLTRRALRLRDRPDFPHRARISAMPRDLHWKTGTSFGHRDAWAVGSGERHTVVVWLGNFDQTPSRWLVGADAAGPVLFDILEGLGDGWSRPTPPAPDDLSPVTVCALTGRLPGEACPSTQPVLAPTRKTPTDRCAAHRLVEVDVETGERVGPGCRDGRSVEQRLVVVWPAEVQRWLSDTTSAESALPPLAADCRARRDPSPLRIRSPEPGLVAVLLDGLPAHQQDIPLEAEAHGRAVLDWYVDGRWVARSEDGERAWWTPSPGRHEVVVMDASGQRATRWLEVRAQGRGPG